VWRNAVVLRLEALRDRLAKLEEIVTRLGEIGHVDFEEFRNDYRHAWLAERGLQLGAQVILDVGNHILAGEYGESALEYQEILRRLGAHGVLTRGLAERLSGLGGFRNILVHGYLTIDPRKVYEALSRAPQDFTDFEAEVGEWLQRRSRTK
jgi:uncharacterized protein YutE (UPF0331/DUF86 family)